MNQKKAYNKIRQRRARRTRARIGSAPARPRLAVFRSNRFIYAQLIDDARGRTVASASSKELAKEKKGSKLDAARKVGALIAERAEKAAVKQAIFDRRAYRYHGRVKALVEGAREGGLRI